MGISHPATRSASSHAGNHRRLESRPQWPRYRRLAGPRCPANSHLAAQRDLGSSRPWLRWALSDRSANRRRRGQAERRSGISGRPIPTGRLRAVERAAGLPRVGYDGWVARSPWMAMIGRLGWDKPGPTRLCPPGPSWTTIIKRASHGQRSNSSSDGRPRTGLRIKPRMHSRVSDSANRFDIMAGLASTDGPSRRPMDGSR